MAKVQAALFCDDIRMEQNGKLILIGAYTGQMIVPSFPAENNLHCMLIIGEIDNPDIKIVAKVSSHDGAAFGQLEMDVNLDLDSLGQMPAWIPLPPFRFSISAPDALEISVGLDGQNPHLVGKLPVILQPND